MVGKVSVTEVGNPDWPLETLGASVVEGHPEASGKITFQTEDKLIHGGVWACSPGVFDLTFGWDEIAYLLEGELIIQESSGQEIQLKAGDFFFSSKGTQSRWLVKKPLKKIFFLRTAEPLG